MKLVEILARELEKWPCDGPATQDPDKEVRFLRPKHDFFPKELADDAGNDYGLGEEVTREMWEAERAKLKATKANRDGWVRHRGGKCPVEAGTMVDVRYRDGKVNNHVPALTEFSKAGSITNRSAATWGHSGSNYDIMAYRIHKPAEQPAEHDLTREPKPAPSLAQRGDTMLAIRDRIRDLDTQRAELNAAYDRQSTEITQERESLVQKLAGEGLALVDAAVRPVEDMSDWRNWRVGDLLRMENADDWDLMLDGKLYEMVNPEDGHNFAIRNDRGDLKSFLLDYRNNVTIDFKWHSRSAS